MGYKDTVAAKANLKIDEEVTYDPFLPVSEIEAKNALMTAENFVKIVLGLVRKENPQLRFSFNK